MRSARALGCLILLSALVGASAPGFGQQPGDIAANVRPATPLTRGAGPKALPPQRDQAVYLVDSTGTLGTLDLSTMAVRVIGRTGVILLDIAFDLRGNLFGVSGNSLYRLDRTTGRATLVGRLRASGVNALACSAGSCYAASSASSTLYTVDTATGRATPVASLGGFLSAGDLGFFDDGFVLSTTDRRLLRLTRAGRITGVVTTNIPRLFGLSGINGRVFGFAGSTVRRIDPLTGASALLGSLAGRGLSTVFGAAYDGRRACGRC